MDQSTKPLIVVEVICFSIEDAKAAIKAFEGMENVSLIIKTRSH